MRLEKSAYIAGGVGAIFAMKEGIDLPHIPDGPIAETSAYVTGVIAGEVHRRIREFEPLGRPEVAKFALTAVGILGINRGVEPAVVVNFMTGLGVTTATFGVFEKVYDLYERNNVRGKRVKENKNKNTE